MIEPEVAGILENLLKNDKLKNSQWMNMTPADFPAFEEISKAEIEKLKDRLKINRQKQSKLTDAYLENLLSEDVFKSKNEILRTGEEELKKLIALQEVRKIERERSKDYLNKVKDFLEGYNPKKKILDLLTKKQVLQLLFKNIKVARKQIFSFEFFAPFQFLFLEEKEKLKCLKNQSLSRIRIQKSSFALSDAR